MASKPGPSVVAPKATPVVNPPVVVPASAEKLNDDPQTWEVPKQLHFIWLGKRPVQSLTETTENLDGKFRAVQVLANAVANKSCTPILWLDLMTMAEREDLQQALDPELFLKYTRWWKLALAPVDRDYLARDEPDPSAPSGSSSSNAKPTPAATPAVTPAVTPAAQAKTPAVNSNSVLKPEKKPLRQYIKSDKVSPRDPAEFAAMAAMLRQAREQFSRWISDKKNQDVFYARKPLVDIMRYDRERSGVFKIPPELVKEYPYFAGFHEQDRNLEVRFLDIDVYPRWMATSPSAPEYSLMNWILFELYFRRSNFGAASDLIRIQLLIDQGGIYVDHDDKIPWLHDPARVGTAGRLMAPNGKYSGFHYASTITEEGRSPVNSFFATPPLHPFLRFYRQQVLADYDSLLRHNYVWVDEKAPAGKQLLGAPKGVQWFDLARGYDQTSAGPIEHRNFATYTIQVSGPAQLRKCLLTVRLSTCRDEKEVAGILDEEWPAVSTPAERNAQAAKAFTDSKAAVLGWKFGTDIYESGKDEAVIPGAAGAWAV